MMNRFFLVIAACLLANSAFPDHITVQGEVSGVWDSDTVLVEADLTVPDGQTLAIQPGTLVEFQGNYAMTVEGSVTAAGTEDNLIIFTVADTTGFGIDSIPDGGGGGIRFDNNRASNDSSVFSFCQFQYGKKVGSDPATGHGGAISINVFSKVRISRCSFLSNFATFNGGAIYLDSADVMISHSHFTGNRCGPAVFPWGYGGAVCSDNSNPEIRWNTFAGNSSTGVGGGLAVRFEDCNLYNNIFSGNVSGLGGAFGYLHIPDSYYRVNNNLIAGNQAVYFGGGVANLDASPVYINNTIAGNTAMYGGGFYCKDSVSPAFYNTIIWGNTAAEGNQGYLFEPYSQADFFYCDIEGGPQEFAGSGGGEAFSGAYEFCLDINPRFANSAPFPYELTWDSPCYNTGASDTSGFMLPEWDLAGNPRVSHNTIDMGAYEIVWVGMEEWGHGGMEAWGHGDIKVYPIPFTDHFTVEIETEAEGEVTVQVFDEQGREIILQSFHATCSGKQQFRINAGDADDGFVLIKITAGDMIRVMKGCIYSHR